MPSTGAIPESDSEPAATEGAQTAVVELRDCTGPLTFDDETLERAVRLTTSEPDGKILPADVTNAFALGAEWMGVEELGGIECLSGLTELCLDFNRVTDLGPLAKLARLRQLDLKSTPVDCSKQATIIRALKRGGCEVNSDCR